MVPKRRKPIIYNPSAVQDGMMTTFVTPQDSFSLRISAFLIFWRILSRMVILITLIISPTNPQIFPQYQYFCPNRNSRTIVGSADNPIRNFKTMWILPHTRQIAGNQPTHLTFWSSVRFQAFAVDFRIRSWKIRMKKLNPNRTDRMRWYFNN